MSATHPRQWEIHDSAPQPDAGLIEAFRGVDTTQLADCGGPVGVVGPTLRHLAGSPDICGVAVTVWTKPGDILFALKATDAVRAGDVLVIDSSGRRDAAVVGDIVGQALVARGAAGLVVDGAVRDVAGLDATGLATFAVGRHPATGSVHGPGAINVPIQLGGVAVHPGDLVRADSSGLVVVPRAHLAQVLELAAAVAEREQRWRRAIAQGTPLPVATGIDDLLAELRPHQGDHSHR